MMVLSRIWYVVCAIAAALAFYAVSLAVGQFNRTLEDAMKENLKSDTQVTGWALQLDSRRHLDAFLLGSSDDGVRKALKAAAAKDGFAAAKVEAKKALARVNERLPEDVRFDAAFVVDREGRVLGQVGFGQAESSPDFELGGYPAVFDALRGFIRDDTWLLAGHVYRVSARPVEDDLGQPPLGAVVGLVEINDRFAQELAKKTRASLVFFQGDRKIGQASSDEELTSAVFEAAAADGEKLEADDYKEGQRTEFRSLVANKTEAAGAVFVRVPGEAGALGATYGVLRRQATHGGPMDFITTATETDKARVKRWLIALLAVGLALIGIALTFLEHARPLAELRRQAAKLRKGEQDSFQLPRLASDYRTIGGDVNGGIERIVEGRGGVVAKKPADLQSILGPVPAQGSMSAFSFPGSQGQVGGPASAPGSVPPPPNNPASVGGGVGNGPPAAKGGFAPPPPKGAPAPKGGPAPKLAPPAPKLVPPSAMHLDDDDPDDQATRVGAAPEQVLAAAAQIRGEVAPPQSGGGPDVTTLAEWRTVFEDFLATKKTCGENVDGLTFEKFQTTLRKNRDALLQRHGTKRVKFSVYVKEGKAALKATPLKE